MPRSGSKYRTPAELGALLRKRRRDLEVTQESLAKQVGTTHPTINRIEKGKVAKLDIFLVARIAEALGLTQCHCDLVKKK